MLLKDLWKDRKILLVFTRFFGCISTQSQLCKKYRDESVTFLVDLQKISDKLKEANVKLVVIADNNTASGRQCLYKYFIVKLTMQREKYPIDGEVYVNPENDAFDAFNLLDGFWVTIKPTKHWYRLLKQMRAGLVTPGSVGTTELSQQGGWEMIVAD